METKLMTSARNDGHRPKSAAHSSRFAASGGRWGTLMSMTSSVMAMANTPSLKSTLRGSGASVGAASATPVAGAEQSGMPLRILMLQAPLEDVGDGLKA